MRIIVGIAGHAGAGKDTFALALQRALVAAGIAPVIDSFAAPIREIAAYCGFRMDREAKERDVVRLYDSLTDQFYEALKKYLGPYMAQDKLAELHAFMLDELEARADVDENLISISPRTFMQLLGTEAGRRTDPQLWVDLLVAKHDDGVVILPDVRFDNELSAVTVLVNVMRPGLTPTAHPSEAFAASLAATRPSQRGGKPVFYVANVSDIGFLEKHAEEFAKHIAARRDYFSAA